MAVSKIETNSKPDLTPEMLSKEAIGGFQEKLSEVKEHLSQMQGQGGASDKSDAVATLLENAPGAEDARPYERFSTEELQGRRDALNADIEGSQSWLEGARAEYEALPDGAAKNALGEDIRDVENRIAEMKADRDEINLELNRRNYAELGTDELRERRDSYRADLSGSREELENLNNDLKWETDPAERAEIREEIAATEQDIERMETQVGLINNELNRRWEAEFEQAVQDTNPINLSNIDAQLE